MLKSRSFEDCELPPGPRSGRSDSGCPRAVAAAPAGGRAGGGRGRTGLIILCLLGGPVLWTGCVGLAGGRKPLTREAIFGPEAINFSGTHAWGLRWLPDGQHYLERREGVLHRVEAVTGESAALYDAVALEEALRLGDFEPAPASFLARHPTVFTQDYRAALLNHGGRLYFYVFEDRTLRRLTEQPAERREITLSPDGRRAAFVHDNNIYSICTDTGRQIQLTYDGGPDVLNGVLDWVYQEELYGRGNWRSYWWSKDGRYIAYLQLDESCVPIYPLLDYLPIHPPVEQLRYPKAGDPNPKVRLGIVPAHGIDTVWVDLTAYEGEDILIVGVSWSPDGKVIFAVQDREQRWLDLNRADPLSGSSLTLLHETSPAWLEYPGAPHWLEDGTFLWLSVADGFHHIYRYGPDGQLIARLTSGPWEVDDLHGVDEASGWVYFTGMRDSPVESHAYRVSLAGGQVQRLTEPGFSHHVQFDRGFRHFIDTFSNITTPTRVRLCDAEGRSVRVISPNPVPELDRYEISWPELVRVPTSRGYSLNAKIIRPLKGGLGRKHPVLMMVYGGPHMPMVRNRWSGDDYGWCQWLARQGYLLWACDPHSASGEGMVSAWRAHQRLGVTELADLEESLHWLAAHENADLNRVGIVGHSYGGYMAAFALTNSRMFKMGIAGSALIDWRNYDSVYAERLMRMPQNNPEGYKRSSAAEAAANLHGRLLIVHGARDDNVHLSNIMQFIRALQQANKSFELMIYPDAGHGVGGPHWDELQLDFIRRNL